MRLKKSIKTFKKKNTSALNKKEKFSEQDKARMQTYIDRVDVSNQIKFIRHGEKGLVVEEPQELWNLTLFEATGTTDPELGIHFFNQAFETNCIQSDDLTSLANKTLVTMHGIGPQDTLEGMLVAQMVGAHNLGMTCMKRAMIKDQYPDAIYRYAKLAYQFCRIFTKQLNTLNKHRGKGQQKVTVEHVHVNEGGQAIVGNINQGGGDNDKN